MRTAARSFKMNPARLIAHIEEFQLPRRTREESQVLAWRVLRKKDAA